MWIADILQKILRLQIDEDEELEEESEPGPALVYWWNDHKPPTEDDLQAFIDEQLDVWAGLFHDQHEYYPTDEQMTAQKMIISHAFSEANKLETAIEYLVNSILEEEEEEIPEWAYNIVMVGIIEYINGNLSLVQDEFNKEQTSG